MKLSRQFVVFVAVGAFSAAVNWLARLMLGNWLPLGSAIIVAYVIGMAVAYTLNRLLVFSPTERGVGSELMRFMLVNVVALAQVWAVTMLLARFAFPAMGFEWRAEAIAHAIGLASPTLTSYFGHRHYSFARARSEAPLD